MTAMDLTLPESLLLLALKDETGERVGSYVDYALAGAAVADLALRGILTESSERSGRFDLARDELTGDGYLDACLGIMKREGFNKDPKKLISKIANTSKITAPLFERLIQRGILHRRTRKVLFFFNQTVYPEADPSAEQALKQRLEEVMFGDDEVSAEDTLIVALLEQTGLLRRNFDKEKLKAHKERIKSIAEGDQLATTAAVEVIKAVHAALMVTVIVAAVIVPTVTS